MIHRNVVSPVLIGRTEELNALAGLLDATQHGRGGMAVIAGDAGVGKTRLCRELKAAAAYRQIRVIEGRSSAAESMVPYGPFMDALRFRLSKGEGDAAAEVLRPILAHVAPLFSSLGEVEDGARANASATPFDSIFNVLRRLAALGPVLFVVEDIQWADATSLDLLHYIARRLTGLPMVVVVTYRTDDVHGGHPVHKLIAALARERAALRLQLEPLDSADVERMLAAMLGAAPDAELVREVYDRTEGNPLFIEEHMSGGSTATLQEIIWDRMARLGNDTREALTVASIIGRRFRFDVLAAALHWTEDRLLAAIEQLIDHHIVVEIADGSEESYSFRHSLVQEVLYGSTIGRRRRVWHREVATALESLGSDTLPHTTLAHHYKLAGDLQKARVHTMLAGDEAARLCAWKDAESMYEAALITLEREGGDSSIAADILERMAEVAWWQNRIDALEEYTSEALTIRRALGDRLRAAVLLRRLANLHAYQRGEVQPAMRMLQEALELLDESDAAERVFVLNDLGRLHVKHGDWEVAQKLFEQSFTISASRGDCAEEALSLVMLGWLSVHGAHVVKGVPQLELARALLAEEPLPVDRAAEVYHAGIRALEAAREHHRAREWVDAALVYASAHGAAGDLAIYRAYQAAVQRRAGEWDSAVAVASDAVAELRANGRAELREALRILGDLQRVRGELGQARASYDEALSLGESDAAIGQALLLIAEEKWNDAADSLALALAAHPSADKLFALRVLPLLVEVRAAAGALDQAQEDLHFLRGLLSGSDYRAGQAALAQATGVLHSASGHSAGAARELRTAVAAWKELDLPFETARATLLLATELIGSRRGQAQGLELAAEAARAFEELGAALEVSRAHSVLRRGGIRVTRRRRREAVLPEPLDRLTSREVEVLFELARGRTNKQIARTLSMSPRTVGNHVSAILAKLDCATRTEASRLALTSRGAPLSA